MEFFTGYLMSQMAGFKCKYTANLESFPRWDLGLSGPLVKRRSAGKRRFCNKCSFSFSLKHFCVKVVSVSCPTYCCLSPAPALVPLLQAEHSRGGTGGESPAHGSAWIWICLGFRSRCCRGSSLLQGFQPQPVFSGASTDG